MRLVNKRSDIRGTGNIFFLSAEHLSKTCGFSIVKAKRVLASLVKKGYIKKISTGNKIYNRANSYKVMNL